MYKQVLKEETEILFHFFQALIVYKSMHHFPDSANLEDKQGRHHYASVGQVLKESTK